MEQLLLQEMLGRLHRQYLCQLQLIPFAKCLSLEVIKFTQKRIFDRLHSAASLLVFEAHFRRSGQRIQRLNWIFVPPNPISLTHFDIGLI